MAQQRIRQSRLPEILAQFGRSPEAEGIKEAVSGFKEGATLASTLAARQQDQKLKELQIQNLNEKLAARKKELAAQDKLASVQEKAKTVSPETPASNIPFGPKKDFATLSDVALTEPVQTSDLTGQRGEDIRVDRPDGTIQQIAMPETEMGLQQRPTGETGASLVPGIKQGLEEQVPGLQQQAFPDVFKPLNPLQESQRKLNEAKALKAVQGDTGTMTGAQVNSLLGEQAFPDDQAVQVGLVKTLLNIGAKDDPALGRKVRVLLNEGGKIDKDIEALTDKIATDFPAFPQTAEEGGFLGFGTKKVKSPERTNMEQKLRVLLEKKNRNISAQAKFGGTSTPINVTDFLNSLFTEVVEENVIDLDKQGQ